MTEVISYTVPDMMGWSQDPVTAANMTYQILGKYDSRFSYTSGSTTIVVDDEFNLSISTGGSSYRYYITISLATVESPSTTLATWNYLYTTWNHLSGGFEISLYRTSDTYYLSLLARDQSGDNSQIGGVFYLHIDSHGRHYFGMLGNNSSGTTQYTTWGIETMGVICADTGVSGYQVKKLADYKLNNFDLFFAPMSILVDDAGDAVKLDSFCSCSNVTYRNTISTNNKNYYAVGTNTLLELPEEES